MPTGASTSLHSISVTVPPRAFPKERQTEALRYQMLDQESLMDVRRRDRCNKRQLAEMDNRPWCWPD